MIKYQVFFICMAMGFMLCSCRKETEKQQVSTGVAVVETTAVLTTENSSEKKTTDVVADSLESAQVIDPLEYFKCIIESAPDSYNDYVKSNVDEMINSIRMQYTDGTFSILKPFCIYELQDEVPVATGVFNYAVTRDDEIVGFISVFEADGEIQYSTTLNKDNPLSRFLTLSEPENEKCILVTYCSEGKTVPEYKWVADEKRNREVEDEIVLVEIE